MKLLVTIFLGLALSGCAVINGKDVADDDFPNVVFATYPTYKTKLPEAIKDPECTGTLISPDIVLTAAHCYCPEQKGRRTFVIFTNNYSAPSIKLEYKKVSGIRNMNCGPFSANNPPGMDIAVLRLQESVTILPARFATSDEIDNAKRFTIVGFGAIDSEAKIGAGRKLRADIPAFDSSCSGKTNGKKNSDEYECEEGQEIIAGTLSVDGTPMTGTCSGDSGGPLFIERKGPHGALEYALAGVTSRGNEKSKDYCGDVGIYVRMTPENKAWIYKAIKELGGQQPTT